jgi:hypothetical protein
MIRVQGRAASNISDDKRDATALTHLRYRSEACRGVIERIAEAWVLFPHPHKKRDVPFEPMKLVVGNEW